MVFKTHNHTVRGRKKYATHYGYEGLFVRKYEILIFFYFEAEHTWDNISKSNEMCVGYKVYKHCQRIMM